MNKKIDYQGVISGSPYYIGPKNFNKTFIEPIEDTIRREVKEETFLSLYNYDMMNRIVNNYDLCFLTNTNLPIPMDKNRLPPNTKLCIDYEDVDIYGKWGHYHRVDRMTPREIQNMEDRLSVYKENATFRRLYNRGKVAVMVIGEFHTLYDFYTTVQPISQIQENFGIILLPLRLVYLLAHQIILERAPLNYPDRRVNPFY